MKHLGNTPLFWRFFFVNLWLLKIGSDWGRLKMMKIRSKNKLPFWGMLYLFWV